MKELSSIQFTTNLTYVMKNSTNLTNYFFYTTSMSFFNDKKISFNKIAKKYKVKGFNTYDKTINVYDFFLFYNKYFAKEQSNDFLSFFKEFVNSNFVKSHNNVLNDDNIYTSRSKFKKACKDVTFTLNDRKECKLHQSNYTHTLNFNTPIVTNKNSDKFLTVHNYKDMLIRAIAMKPEATATLKKRRTWIEKSQSSICGVSHDTIADIIGVTQSYVSQVLNGEKLYVYEDISETDFIKFRNTSEYSNRVVEMRNLEVQKSLNSKTGEVTTKKHNKYLLFVGTKKENLSNFRFNIQHKNKKGTIQKSEIGKINDEVKLTSLVNRFSGIDVIKNNSDALYNIKKLDCYSNRAQHSDIKSITSENLDPFGNILTDKVRTETMIANWNNNKNKAYYIKASSEAEARRKIQMYFFLDGVHTSSFRVSISDMKAFKQIENLKFYIIHGKTMNHSIKTLMGMISKAKKITNISNETTIALEAFITTCYSYIKHLQNIKSQFKLTGKEYDIATFLDTNIRMNKDDYTNKDTLFNKFTKIGL